MDKAQFYKPPIGTTIGKWGVIVLWLAVIYQTIINPEMFMEDAAAWYTILAVVTFFGFINLWRYPIIEVLPEELRVYHPWGTYKAVSWQDVKEIRLPDKPFWVYFRYPENYVVIKANKLGFIYAIIGLVFERGGQAFFIFRYQKGYKNLLEDFKKYAPFALAKELRKD